MTLLAHAEPLATHLGDLIADIEQTHHTYTRDALEQIAELFDAAGMAAPLGLRRCFDALQADLIPHLMKEEQVLFPYIVALESNPEYPPHACFGSVANPIRMMQLEHHHVKTLLVSLRELTFHYAPTGDAQTNALYVALAALDQDLEQHIKTEDGTLFPRMLQLEQNLIA